MQLPAQLPPLELVQIAYKALAFDPTLRYRSANEYKSILESYNQRVYLFERLEEIRSQSEQTQRQTLPNRTIALLGLSDQLNVIQHSLQEQTKENLYSESPAANPNDENFDRGQLLQTQIERHQAQICERLIESALLQKDYGLAANQLILQKERIDQNQQRVEERTNMLDQKPTSDQDDDYLLRRHSTDQSDCQADFWNHREETRTQQQNRLQRGLSSQRWAARLKWIVATLAGVVILFGIGMAVQYNLREQDRQKTITAQKDKETAVRMRQLSELRSRLGQVEEANWGSATFEIRKQIAKLDPKNAELYAQTLIDCQTQLFPVERHDGLKTALAANSSGINHKSRLKVIPIFDRGEVLAYRSGDTVIYRCRDISLEILETISVTPFLNLPGIEGTAPVESRPETLDQTLIRQGASVLGNLPKMRSNETGETTIISVAVPENNPRQFAVGLSNNEILVFNLKKEKTNLDFKILHSAEKLFALSTSTTIDLKNMIVSRNESHITTSSLIFSPDGSQLAIISQFITPQTINNVTDEPGYRARTNSSGLTGVSVWQVNQRQQTMQMSLELPSKRKKPPILKCAPTCFVRSSPVDRMMQSWKSFLAEHLTAIQRFCWFLKMVIYLTWTSERKRRKSFF